MTTGAEHYQEAERLLALAESTDWTTDLEPYRDPALAAAQVHATLAHAAATAGEWVWPTGDALAARQWRPLLNPETTP